MLLWEPSSHWHYTVWYVVFVATVGQTRQVQNCSDVTVLPSSTQLQCHKDSIQQQQHRQDFHSSATSSGHSWSSSPDSFLYRPSSALRNSPAVYVMFTVLLYIMLLVRTAAMPHWSYFHIPFRSGEGLCNCLTICIKITVKAMCMYTMYNKN